MKVPKIYNVYTTANFAQVKETGSYLGDKF